MPLYQIWYQNLGIMLQMFWQEVVVVVIALRYAKIITWKPRVFPLHHSTFALGYREKYIDRERMISYPGWYFEREQYHNIIWIELNALSLTWHLSGQPILPLSEINERSNRESYIKFGPTLQIYLPFVRWNTLKSCTLTINLRRMIYQ